VPSATKAVLKLVFGALTRAAEDDESSPPERVNTGRAAAATR
jgi:hypothetical protein